MWIFFIGPNSPFSADSRGHWTNSGSEQGEWLWPQCQGSEQLSFTRLISCWLFHPIVLFGGADHQFWFTGLNTGIAANKDSVGFTLFTTPILLLHTPLPCDTAVGPWTPIARSLGIEPFQLTHPQATPEEPVQCLCACSSVVVPFTKECSWDLCCTHSWEWGAASPNGSTPTFYLSAFVLFLWHYSKEFLASQLIQPGFSQPTGQSIRPNPSCWHSWHPINLVWPKFVP